jgi:hypothetical protein
MKLDDALTKYILTVGINPPSLNVFQAIRSELVLQAAEIVAQQRRINDLTDTVYRLSELFKNGVINEEKKCQTI